MLGDEGFFGARLRALRKRMRVQSKDVAAALEVSQRHYVALERGDSEMSVRQLIAACEAIGVHPAVVLDDRVWL